VRPNLPWLPMRVFGLGAAVLSMGVLAACSSSSSSTSTSTSTSTSSSASASASSSTPITIGASLSLTGDFSADGQAFEKGYELWASDVNAKGGLLGRQVQLKILNDNSSPTQVATNYTTLFGSYKVDLAFGPFSSLLTTPSASVAAHYGYALVEGAGGAPSVFNSPANVATHNVFDVSLPVEDNFIPFVNWVASLPPSQRPKTAAYPMADDPFADPPVQLAQQKLQALGVKTVYSKIFPAEAASYKPAADQVAATGAQAVLLGSTDVPTVAAFMQAFEQQHYNPMMFICAAGPDQGAAFTSAVGKGNATGMMVPNGWYPGYANPESQAMVNEYVAKYGGSPSDINADVAEAYSVGQVMAQAVTATGGTNNAKIISYLHSGVTLNTVQGPVKFDELGKNSSAAAFTFQWQSNGTAFKQVLPAAAAGSVPIINPKPNWAS
jgi:branched-chain amino acid transport system substrate-binding protein